MGVRTAASRADTNVNTRSFSGSLHAWKVFNMALKRLNVHDIESNGNPQSDPGESDTDEETIGLRRFYHHISFPTADFDVYTKPLQATGAFDFVSHIRIAGASPIRTEDLLLLPGLRNLGVLEIAEPGEGVAPRPLVSDRILRAWSEREDAFPRLLALRIAAAHDVTKECLQYAAKLPSLAVLQLHAGRGGWSGWGQNAAESGWLVHEGDDLFETGRSSTGTKACVDPRPSEHGGGGEWAYLACQLARSLPRPRPLGTRQNEVEHRAGGGSGLGVPFASLCLGEDRYTVERFMAPKVFLRRQPSVTGQDDGSASEMPRKAGRGRSENGGQTSKKRRVGPGRSAGGEQSTKKQRRAGIADLLSGFEG